ncbi:MAG: DUF2752 domain-containing protein [Bacteroidetes bacterium]|jgi:hypothetical protein|nr:DUF2752 domain-containing protein [Bacteroidota bacterium]
MRIGKSFQDFFFLHFEWCILVAALLMMVSIDPSEHAFSFCIIDMLGFSFCPGDGFGRSVALLFRGEFLESFRMHPFGIPGAAIILHRIFSLHVRNHAISNSL